MTRSNLSRRLERLEGIMTPAIARRVWEVVILHPDGRHEKIREIVWPAPPAADSVQAESPSTRARR